jgi:oligopeptide transport system substrate-binding protein
MTIITKKSLVAAGILSALITANVAMAADVPAGVQLADKQTLVRNNGRYQTFFSDDGHVLLLHSL